MSVHVEAARKAIVAARTAGSRAVVEREASLAQVQATLALAEQQRLANLLAYGRGLIADLVVEDLTLEQYAVVKARSEAIGSLIAEGLGLS